MAKVMLENWIEAFNLALRHKSPELAQDLCLESTWIDDDSFFSKVFFNKLARQNISLKLNKSVSVKEKLVASCSLLMNEEIIDEVYLNFVIEHNVPFFGTVCTYKKNSLAYLNNLLPLIHEYDYLKTTTQGVEVFESLCLEKNLLSNIQGLSLAHNDQQIEEVANKIDHDPSVLKSERVFQLLEKDMDITVVESVYFEGLQKFIVKLRQNTLESDLYINLKKTSTQEWRVLSGGVLPLIRSLIEDLEFEQEI